MKSVLGCHFAAFAFSSLLLACEPAPQQASKAPPDAGAVAERGQGATSATVSDSGSPCPRTGQWAVCSLEKRLEQSGFVLRKTGDKNPRRLGFTVQPLAYELGRARLEIFIYPDDAVLARDVARMDTIAVAPRGQANDWEIPPRFIRSANLIAVFLTRNEQQAERLTLAVTAGPPQR